MADRMVVAALGGRAAIQEAMRRRKPSPLADTGTCFIILSRKYMPFTTAPY